MIARPTGTMPTLPGMPAGTSTAPIYDLHSRLRGAQAPALGPSPALRQQKIAARQAEKQAGRMERRKAAAPAVAPTVPAPVAPAVPIAQPTTPVTGV